MGDVTFQKKVNGSMQTLQTNQPFKLNISNPNLQEFTIDPSANSKSSFPITPSTGYDGFSAIKFADTQNILISDNIKQGVTLFGVEGNITGGGNIYTNQIKVTTNGQVAIPSGYDGASNILVNVPSGGLEPYDLFKDGRWFDGWIGYVQNSYLDYQYDSVNKAFKLKATANYSNQMGHMRPNISVPDGYEFLCINVVSGEQTSSFGFYMNSTESSLSPPATATTLPYNAVGKYYYYIPADLRSSSYIFFFGAAGQTATNNHILVDYVGFTQTSE